MFPTETLDWNKIHYGRITKHEISKYVYDDDWQRIRIAMIGMSLGARFVTLDSWLEKNKYDRRSQVQVTNYINALSRGGMIKPEEYQSYKDKTKYPDKNP